MTQSLLLCTPKNVLDRANGTLKKMFFFFYKRPKMQMQYLSIMNKSICFLDFTLLFANFHAVID